MVVSLCRMLNPCSPRCRESDVGSLTKQEEILEGSILIKYMDRCVNVTCLPSHHFSSRMHQTLEYPLPTFRRFFLVPECFQKSQVWRNQ